MDGIAWAQQIRRGDVTPLEALEAAYRERGYNVVTVELPEQELNGGVVQLRVVETRIGRVSVKGKTGSIACQRLGSSLLWERACSR